MLPEKQMPVKNILFVIILSVWMMGFNRVSPAPSLSSLPGKSFATAAYELQVSQSPDRSNPVPLEGQTVSGNIYVFTSPESGVSRVRFFLDDPNMTGKPRQTEGNPPFDFAGGTSSTANPFWTSSISDGSHTITAALDLTAGGIAFLHASFIVANTGPALVFNPSGLSTELSVGGSASEAAQLATTNGAETAYTLVDDASWLSVSPESGVTPASHNIAVDASGLSPGTYNGAVTASAPGYTSASLKVVLTISSASPALDQVHLAWVGDPSTTLTVVWRTWDTATASTVEYRTSGASEWQTATGSLRPSGTTGTLHEVLISSLTPATTYEYRVQGDGGIWSETFTTRTAPSRGPANFDVIYVADTGLVGRTDGLASGTQQVIDEIAALNPLLVLPGGDYIYYDTDKRYGSLDNTIDAWFNQMQPVAARSPLMPTYGNHEALLDEGFQPWADRFPTPQGYDGRRNYSFDIGDVHFVSIFAVSNSARLTSEQLQWIEQDITAARAAGQPWIIPYFHVSPFSDGTNHPSNLKLRGQLGSLFERLGVKLVISSHDQAFERTYPLTGVPATNAPTSTSLSCYTLDDGVTWVKVSPGGKLSSLNHGFSSFATNPPPAWTAVRENTMHHFSRLVVSTSSIRLDTYGVIGDGTPPVVIDSFQYTEGICEPGLLFGTEDLSFTLEQESSGSKSLTLDTNNETAASFTVSVDSSWLTITPPSGTTPAALTVTADASGLAPGTYNGTITASAPGYTAATRQVNLTVTGPSGGDYQLMASTSSDRANPTPLEGQSVSGSIYVFTRPDTTDIARVRFFLDNPEITGTPRRTESSAPYDFAGGTVSTANPFRSTTISNGSHTITAAIDFANGETQVIHSTFTVNN